MLPSVLRVMADSPKKQPSLVVPALIVSVSVRGEVADTADDPSMVHTLLRVPDGLTPAAISKL